MSNLASKFYQHHPLKYMNATLNAPCAPQPFYYTIIIILQFVLQEVSQKQNSAVYNIQFQYLIKKINRTLRKISVQFIKCRLQCSYL